MASRREKAPSLRMRRIALVICEGQTEENYIGLLRNWYKSPVRIVSHIFLMYDMDVPSVNEKVKSCKATPLLSNPCFEIWLLLHAKEQTAPVSTESVIRELKNSASVWRNYTKSSFTDTQKSFLKDNIERAVDRAKKLKDFRNPSTGIYKLIEILQDTILFD